MIEDILPYIFSSIGVSGFISLIAKDNTAETFQRLFAITGTVCSIAFILHFIQGA